VASFLAEKKRPPAAVGSAAILAAVSGILPETLRAGLASEIGVLPEEDLAGCQIRPFWNKVK